MRRDTIGYQAYISQQSAQHAEEMADIVTELRAQRPPPTGQPVTAPPARRCADCGLRAWTWVEVEAGAGRWVCGACQG